MWRWACSGVPDRLGSGRRQSGIREWESLGPVALYNGLQARAPTGAGIPGMGG